MAIRMHKFTAKVDVKTFASTLALAGAIASTGVMAQTNDENLLEEVLVTGQRASLQNAQEIKRNADTFVDAISAADIGALPDRSVLEALQRLPGVSIERFASSNDPDHFSSEGSSAVVRGMSSTLIRTEFNGRDSFTASSGRGLSYQDISPELMGSVALYKNQTADMVEGGIGGTVNLQTRKPFDTDERIVAFSADYTYFDLSENSSPSFSGLLSDTWDTDAGRFGALVSLAHGESSTRSDSIQSSYHYANDNSTGLFNSPESVVHYPSGSNVGMKLDERERNGIAVALQWENPDETVEMTFQFLRSDSDFAWTEQKMTVKAWDSREGTDTRPMEGTQFEFDDDGVFRSGILSDSNFGWRGGNYNNGNGNYNGLRAPQGYYPGGDYCNGTIAPAETDDPVADAAAHEQRLLDDNCDERVQTFGQGSSTISAFQDQNTLVDDYAFNIKFNPNERWEFEADFQYIDAQSSRDGMSLRLNFNALNYYDTNGGDPVMGIINPWEAANATTVASWDQKEADAVQQRNDDIAWNAANPDEEPRALFTEVLPINRQATDYFSSPSSYYWSEAQDNYQRAEGEETALRLDATHFMESSIINTIKVGVRHSTRQQEVRDTYNYGSLARFRSFDDADPTDVGYTAGWADMALTDQLDVVDWSDFNRGDGTFIGAATYDDATGAVIPLNNFTMLHPSMDLVQSYGSWDPLNTPLEPVYDLRGDDPWEPASQRDANSNGGYRITQGHFLPSDLSDIKETNTAAYIRFDYAFDNFKFPISGNFGVRYFEVELESSGFTRFPDLVPKDTVPNVLTSVNHFLAANHSDQSNYGNNVVDQTFAEHSYDDILPSFNMKVEFTEELLARFAVSKAVALPDIGDLRSYLNINANLTRAELEPIADPRDAIAVRAIESVEVDFWSASGGNPFLLPMESIQYDASLEWYFADVGSITGSVFYKELDNFFVDGGFPRTVTNPTNGISQEVVVNSLINGGEGSLSGFEFAYQQYFDMLPAPWDGVGVQFNYTLIDVEGVPNPAIQSGSEDYVDDERSEEVIGRLPLQSQSKHTFNFALMYEKGPISLRAAYNWRSRYLVTARDGSNRPWPATWAGDGGYLDASAFYNITDDIKIGLQGQNLTNTVATTEFQSTDSQAVYGRSWFTNDRKISLVLRALF